MAAANEAFAPSEAEVLTAHRVLAAHAEACAKGAGVLLLDGRLIENLHVEEAKATVAFHEAIEEPTPAAALHK